MQKLAEERMKKLSSYKKLKGPYSVKISDVKTGTWRKYRPVITHEKCTRCKLCIEYCPCGVMELKAVVDIDYTYCKGCGICAEECPRKAIAFIEEDKFEKRGGSNGQD